MKTITVDDGKSIRWYESEDPPAVGYFVYREGKLATRAPKSALERPLGIRIADLPRPSTERTLGQSLTPISSRAKGRP